MTEFTALPDFGFLTLGEAERRRARREQKGGLDGRMVQIFERAL